MAASEQLISAALIVRDEEKYLPACLASIAGLADEIIVVDTGSRDSSREIAAAHGAQVLDFRWDDDFAAARNLALDHATHEWILYIDADERVRPYDRRKLEVELSEPGICVRTVRFHPKSGFTAYREFRLFRRHPRIRFRGAFHETIMPDVHRIVAAGEGRIGASELTMDHVGYDGDQLRKALRNLPLLEKQLRADPERIYLWWHLGAVYRDLGRLAEAEAAWRHGIEIDRSRSNREPGDALCFIELAKLRIARGERAQALVWEAAQLHPNNLLLDWLKARLLTEDGRYVEAMSIFDRLARTDANGLVADFAYDHRILGAWAFAEMGYCAFRMGRYRDSENWYRHAEALEPTCLEFRIKRELAGKRGAQGEPRSD